MQIGEDFKKIEVDFWGLKCVEPNALIGDVILFTVALLLTVKIFQLKKKHTFYTYWILFFVIFGFSFFAGGLGHFFFNYWGVSGKYAAWFSSVVAVFFLERAMISIYPNRKGVLLFTRLAYYKLVISLAAMIAMYSLIDLESDPQKGLLIPSLNSAVGMILCLGILARRYQILWEVRFHFFFLSLVMMVPSAIAQAFKINFHPWFDRNDLSHLMLLISLLLYWKGILAFSKLKIGHNQ